MCPLCTELVAVLLLLSSSTFGRVASSEMSSSTLDRLMLWWMPTDRPWAHRFSALSSDIFFESWQVDLTGLSLLDLLFAKAVLG